MNQFLILSLLLLFSCNDLKRQTPAILSQVKHETETYRETVQEIDLLDVFLEIPIQLTNNKIIFNESRQSKDLGMHSICESSVIEGDSYTYVLKNDYLILTDTQGEETVFTRLTKEGSEIFGAWSTQYMKDKLLIRKRLVILNEHEMVERTHCEG